MGKSLKDLTGEELVEFYHSDKPPYDPMNILGEITRRADAEGIRPIEYLNSLRNEYLDEVEELNSNLQIEKSFTRVIYSDKVITQAYRLFENLGSDILSSDISPMQAKSLLIKLNTIGYDTPTYQDISDVRVKSLVKNIAEKVYRAHEEIIEEQFH